MVLRPEREWAYVVRGKGRTFTQPSARRRPKSSKGVPRAVQDDRLRSQRALRKGVVASYARLGEGVRRFRRGLGQNLSPAWSPATWSRSLDSNRSWPEGSTGPLATPKAGRTV